MTDAWRCFVSVPIPDGLRASLGEAVDGWRSRPDLAGLRWTDPNAWHLTLAFLGATDPGAVDRLGARLASIAAGHRRFDLPTGGLGGFPSDGRARVAWYGIEDPDGRLRSLADDVGRGVDLEADRQFTAHLTLGRTGRDRLDLRPWIREADAPRGTLKVASIELMRSHPGRGPGRYESLASARLGSAHPRGRP